MPGGQPWPKISIVTPSYNQGKFIEETIRSVLLQGYPSVEYIIIDGGSRDHSVEVIKKYQKWLAYWVSEPDRGQSHAINKGFEKATGEIYAWLNSDDYLLKDALRNVAEAYRSSPNSGGWFGATAYVNTQGTPLGVCRPNRLDMVGLGEWGKNNVGQPACLFSKTAWHVCGPLDVDLHFGMDLDLWLKIAKKFSIMRVDNVLAVERFHSDAKTQIDRGRMYAWQVVIQIRHGFTNFAVEDITQWMNDYLQLRGKAVMTSRFIFLRPIIPIVGLVRRKVAQVLHR